MAAAPAIPVATWIFGALAGACLLRGLWNPTRAVAAQAKLVGCPGGPACNPTVTLDVKGDVYSACSGTVASVGPDWVHVWADDEPVVLGYFGLKPSVVVGQGVGRGQPIGAGPGHLGFGVWAVNGQTLSPIEPSSWLASRGFALAADMGNPLPGTGLWCGGGNKIVVPPDVHNVCKFGMPAQPDFLLFPVSITQG